MMKKMYLFWAALTVALTAPAAGTGQSDPEIVKSKGAERNYTGIFPAHIKNIAVITPASYPNVKYTQKGIELLRKAGYKVKVASNVFTRPEGVEKNSYKAIPVALRVKDFEAAWRDPEIDMIICSRGGSGTADLVAQINWSGLSRRPELYVMGYSDVTMLLCAMSAKGYGRPIAGPVVSSLASLNKNIMPQIKKMFHGEALVPIKLKAVRPGECAGKTLAGLLNRFVLSVRNKYGVDTKGKIIIIECVRSTPEKIRSDLDELVKEGFFTGASGVVFGHFLQSGKREVINGIFNDFAQKVKIPVYRGLPFGHNSLHMAVDFTRHAVIKKNILYFPAVQK